MGFKFLLKQAENSHILTTVLEPEDPSYDFDKMHDLLYEKGFTLYPEKIGKKRTFRIANIGAIDYHDINKSLKELKNALT